MVVRAPEQTSSPHVRIAYDLVEPPGGWLLDEGDTPESTPHEQARDLLERVLLAWVAREQPQAAVARDLACRWDPADHRVGVDPDLCLLDPPPPGPRRLDHLHLWQEGHVAPRLGVEIVSRATAEKDYVGGPARYARLGTTEVWVIDPLLLGPSTTGGPFELQVWRMSTEGVMVRHHAGPAPAWSEELDAWLVLTSDRQPRLASDPAGQQLWPTEAEPAAPERPRAGAARAPERAPRDKGELIELRPRRDEKNL